MKTIEQIEIEIASVFHSAFICKQTSDVLNTRLNKLLIELQSRTPAGKLRYPKFFHNYAAGFIAAKRRQLQEKLEFCYLWDGVIYSTDRNSTRALPEDFFKLSSKTVDALPKGLYWKDTTKLFHQLDIQNEQNI